MLPCRGAAPGKSYITSLYLYVPSVDMGFVFVILYYPRLLASPACNIKRALTIEVRAVSGIIASTK